MSSFSLIEWILKIIFESDWIDDSLAYTKECVSDDLGYFYDFLGDVINQMDVNMVSRCGQNYYILHIKGINKIYFKIKISSV